MKRFHVHMGVKDLESSVRFYSTLFGQEPAKLKPDYAKWMLDDPRISFAISTRTQGEGVDHLGIQVESEGDLREISDRLKAADLGVRAEGETTCCYARSDKAWVEDPSGVPWETYRNMGDAEVFSEKAPATDPEPEAACCVPGESSCC
jgi:catechol 2,3-dioxygenase-like lactoylglutathione lyase family enzyme